MRTLSYLPGWFRLLVVSSILVVSYGLFTLDRTESTAQNEEVGAQAHELHDTLWLDRVPEMMHDSWQGYLFTPDNVGLAINAESAFKLTLEIFEFQLRKDTIRWHFPHDGQKAQTKYTVEKLKKPTKHFDRQLTIENDPKNNGKTKVYFTGPEFSNSTTIEAIAPGALSALSQGKSARSWTE